MIEHALLFGCGAMVITLLLGIQPAIALYAAVDQKYSKNLKLLFCVGYCFIFCVAFIVGWNFIPPVHLPDVEHSYTVPIYSSDLSSKIHGDFLLGSGQVNSEFVYTFYRGDNINGFNLDFYPTSKSKIFMDENKDPYVKVIWTVDPNIQSVDFKGMDGYEIYNTRHYEFHVPENSIVQKYDMNLR